MSHAQTNPSWLVEMFPQNLQAQITYLTLHKYILIFQNEKTAQLVRRKKFSFLIAFIGVLLWFIGFIVYLIWYLAKEDDTIYLDISTQPPAIPPTPPTESLSPPTN